jgi:hypothetical protein
MERCHMCGKERELLTTVSTQLKNGRTYNYQVQEGHCQVCLELKQWSSLLIDDYQRLQEWKWLVMKQEEVWLMSFS